MSTYPKQLQKFAGNTNFRKGFGDEQVLPAVAVDVSVNVLLNILHKADRNVSTVHDGKRIEERFRPFDTSFGTATVSLDAVPHTANEIIDRMRAVYDSWHAWGPDNNGHATSVQN